MFGIDPGTLAGIAGIAALLFGLTVLDWREKRQKIEESRTGENYCG